MNKANPSDIFKFTGLACPPFRKRGEETCAERRRSIGLAGIYPERSRRVLARNYDPEIGRFLSVDPLADLFPSWSPYNYTMNNPVNMVDPTGTNPVCGQSNNCDEIYKTGAEVSNNKGSWIYMGNNQWRPVDANYDQSATNLYRSLISDINRPEIGLQNRNFYGQTEDFIASLPPGLRGYAETPYKAIDALFVISPHQDVNTRITLSGTVLRGSKITERSLDLYEFVMPSFAGKLRFMKKMNIAQFNKANGGTWLARLSPKMKGWILKKFNEEVAVDGNANLVEESLDALQGKQ